MYLALREIKKRERTEGSFFNGEYYSRTCVLCREKRKDRGLRHVKYAPSLQNGGSSGNAQNNVPNMPAVKEGEEEEK